MSDNRDLVAPPRLNSLACGFRFGGRARFGVILPSGNIVAEGDLAALLPRDISLHVTRLRLTGSSREQLNAMAEDGAAVPSTPNGRAAPEAVELRQRG